MSSVKKEELPELNLTGAFWNAHNGERLKSDVPYVRFVFDHSISPLWAERQLRSALYAHAGFPSLISNDDYDNMRIVGYGQNQNGDEYVDLSFSDDPKDTNFIDGLTHKRFLASFMAVGVKQVETSDGRSFDLQNVQFPIVTHKKTR